MEMKTPEQILIEKDCYQSPTGELEGRVISTNLNRFIEAMKEYANLKLDEASEVVKDFDDLVDTYDSIYIRNKELANEILKLKDTI